MARHGTQRIDTAADDRRALAAAPAGVRHRCRITALRVEQASCDGSTLDVTAVVCWHISNVQLAEAAFRHGRLNVTRIALAALRSTIGGSKLASLLCDRAAVGQTWRQRIQRDTAAAGITVHSAEITDVCTPASVQACQDAAVLDEIRRCRIGPCGLTVRA